MRAHRREGGVTTPGKLAVACLLMIASAAAHSQVEARDDTGRSVALETPARRIVSLAPHATEILFAAGAGGRLVGAVEYSDYPPPARRIPRVGAHDALDLERIRALAPDLVVAWASGNRAGQVERIEGMGMTVYRSEPRGLSDIAENLAELGRLAGVAEEAAHRASVFRERRRALAARFADRPTLRVFYEVWHDPLTTINGEHLISDVLRLCGARNVFADLPALAPTVSVEAVLAADPQVIVASAREDGAPPGFERWRRWPALAAVRADNLVVAPPDVLQRPGPRILDGAEALCRRLDAARDKLIPSR